MMTTLRALVIAFSMYSQIPMPQFTWQDKEMKYAFCFFPWVGAAIGGITMFWWWFCGKFSVGNVAFAMIGTAIPLAVTGGFHVDGFMDTMDAFHSYQPREKKLEILKDSHIGAFSVIAKQQVARSDLLFWVVFSIFRRSGRSRISGHLS